MARHPEQELDQLKRDLLAYSTLVEEALERSIAAFAERRTDLAEAVITEDHKIDQREVEIDEKCLKILALHQHSERDLRLITVVMKINNDLERIGDAAVSIAKRARHLAMEPPVKLPPGFARMADLTREMVRKSLAAFVSGDAVLAREVCAQDDEVDELNRRIVNDMRQTMKEGPDRVDPSLDIFSTTRRLERIADLATNIAEDVVYVVEGEIIRHSEGDASVL